jgi:hypothetical protein
LRKLLLVVAVAALAGGTLTACIGGPPPQPTDPHDVLVVGDSVSFSLGCVLGDGHNTPGCPSRTGYTTVNEFSGGCTISPGTLELYNGGQANAPNCDTQPDQHGLTWAQAAAQYVPKVVVINTAGWEIVDRWIQCPPFCGAPPDNEWGGTGKRYDAAAAYYSNELFNAINMFRAGGAKVVIANSPYIQPLQPEPPPSAVSDPALYCSWWEAYQSTAPPSAGPDCTGNATPGSGGQWRSPDGASPYRSSKTKIDQFNAIVQQVKDNNFGSDPNVLVFQFKKHFNGPDNAYHDYICPPPDDATQMPIPDLIDGTPNCPIPADLTRNAISARAIDHSHLSPGGDDILQYYLEPCVQSLLGIGGDPAKCQ